MMLADEHIAQLSHLLRLDLSAYHAPQINRLLWSFMQRRGFADITALLTALHQNRELRKELLDSLGINVTCFFRDPQMWDVLAQRILPDLLQRFGVLNVWSAGCSVGKEPYSLAAVLHYLKPQVPHRILATDIDDAALQQAREGRYSAEDINEIPPVYRSYFVIQDGVLTVLPALRSIVRFDRLNLLTDPYPKGVHLLVCRNLLIYFRSEVKPKIFHGFAQSLVTGGVLFLGASEVLFNPAEYGFKMLQFGFYQRM